MCGSVERRDGKSRKNIYSNSAQTTNLFRQEIFASAWLRCFFLVCHRRMFAYHDKMNEKCFSMWKSSFVSLVSRRKTKVGRLTERNCMDESPSDRQFFVWFALSRAPFCCRRASWRADCPSAGTMLAAGSSESSMIPFRWPTADSATAPPSASHKGTHHQNEPAWIKDSGLKLVTRIWHKVTENAYLRFRHVVHIVVD